MTGLILGLSSLFIAVSALALSLHTYLTHDKGLRSAFKRLELDAETMWDKVESHLGRISRLRRNSGERATTAALVPPQDEQLALPIPGSLEMPLPRGHLTRGQLLAWSRRPRAIKTSDGSAR